MRLKVFKRGTDISEYFESSTSGSPSETSCGQWINLIKKIPAFTLENTIYEGLFKGFKGQEIDLSTLDTSNSNSFYNMFSGCYNLTSLDITNFNTSNVTDMSYMFRYCYELTSLNLSTFDTSKVTTMKYMFYYCRELKKIDISNFSDVKLTDNSSMFSSCSKLEQLIINSPSVFKMTNRNMVDYNQFYSGIGYIYVPDNLVDAYKSATNWSNYASHIKGISELPTEVA